MKFLILGAGGIGCYYGARLLQAGHEVVFVARGAHLAAMAGAGLKVTHPDMQFSGAVTAVAVEDLLLHRHRAAHFDLIILAAKASSTRELMCRLQNWLAGCDVPVLSIQNGVTNEGIIAELLGKTRTVGGLAVRIGGHIVAPGEVEATGVAQIEMGAWPVAESNQALQVRLASIVDAFNQAGIPTTLTHNIERALWRKLVINNGVNPLSALTYLDTRAMTSDPVLGRTVYRLMEETGRAANAAGVAITRDDVDAMFRLISEFDAIKTSMLVDRIKGRAMEVEDICGPVIEYCHQAGQPAETTELIRSLLLANSVNHLAHH
jgi:2-dehydropantoate 2-reductase